MWGETELLGTAATSGPTVPVPVLCMNMEQGWNANRQGKVEELGEKPVGDDHGSIPDLCRERNNYLNYCRLKKIQSKKNIIFLLT